MSKSKFIFLNEMVADCGTSRTALNRALDAGHIPFVQLGGRRGVLRSVWKKLLVTGWGKQHAA